MNFMLSWTLNFYAKLPAQLSWRPDSFTQIFQGWLQKCYKPYTSTIRTLFLVVSNSHLLGFQLRIYVVCLGNKAKRSALIGCTQMRKCDVSTACSMCRLSGSAFRVSWNAQDCAVPAFFLARSISPHNMNLYCWLLLVPRKPTFPSTLTGFTYRSSQPLTPKRLILVTKGLLNLTLATGAFYLF